MNSEYTEEFLVYVKEAKYLFSRLENNSTQKMKSIIHLLRDRRRRKHGTEAEKIFAETMRR